MANSYYFAYGSNLSLDQMGERCPLSVPVCAARLVGWRWLIGQRGYATIAAHAGAVTHGALYALHPRDEARLDVREGVSLGCYGKFYLDVEAEDDSGRVEHVSALVYIDPRSTKGEAEYGYVARCHAGAYEWGLPASFIKKIERAFPAEPF